MKTNFQNNFAVWFDLHDTLLDSTKAWIEAFEKIAKDKTEFEQIKEEYLLGGWKREILKKRGYDYDEVKDVYLSLVEPIKEVKCFYEFLKNSGYKVFVVTNAKMVRAKEDIDLLGVDFDKVYSRDDGVKPDSMYIKKILKENNLDFAVMIGNEKERDIFDVKNVKTIIVDGNSKFEELKKDFEKIICEI